MHKVIYKSCDRDIMCTKIYDYSGGAKWSTSAKNITNHRVDDKLEVH